MLDRKKHRQEVESLKADNRQKDMNRRTSERRGQAGLTSSSSDATRPSPSKLGWRSLLPRLDYPERELTTSREESGARSDYPEARRKKTIVKEETRSVT